MRYSDELVDEIVSRNNIVDIIGEHVQLKRSGSNYMGLCPFHNEKTPSFSVSESKQFYYCFGCHAGGNALTFLMAYNNFTFKEALEYLAERAGMELPAEAISENVRRADSRRKKLLEIHKAAAAFYYYRLYSGSGKDGLAYFKKRGLSDETIRHFGLGYADKYGNTLYRYLKGRGYDDAILKDTGLFLYDEKHGFSDKFWNRVMFPIMDGRGRVIGFGGRVMGDGKPKYLNSPETELFNKRQHLYALNYARSARRNYMILCEGYMDVISMHQAGVTCAVASLGTALTPEQCRLISKFKNEVLLIYDSDGAGVNATLRAIPMLREAGISARVVNLRPHKDPDEFIKAEGAEAFEERLKKAENAFLFEADRMYSETDASDPAQVTAFQRKVARRLLSFPEELERENYLNAFCEKFRVNRDAMKKLVVSEAAKGTPAERYHPPKSGQERARQKESGAVTAQKALLAFLASYPEAYGQVKAYLGADDFTDPLCRETAELLLDQLAEGKVSESAIISHFPDQEKQSQAVEIFHTEFPVKSQKELDQAFRDAFLGVLEDGAKNVNGNDIAAAQKMYNRRREIEEIRKKTFHLPYRQ